MTTSANSFTETTTAAGVPVRLVPNGWRPVEDCLTLAEDELAWLDRFREQLLEQYPGLVDDIIVYGFRARGLADLDLRMDVLVVISEGVQEIGKEIGHLGYDISLETGAFPMTHTLTGEQWDEIKRTRPSFYLAALDESISVL